MNVIKPLPIVKLTVDKTLMTYFMNGGVEQDLYASIWYIEGPKEKIIVDTGADAETIKGHGFPSEQIATPQEALAKVGLKPEDIDIVILTQMHLDHIEYARQFTNAKLIVQKSEYDFAMDPHPVQAALYVKDMYEDLNFETIEGDKEIAEGVKVLLTPGHTPGSQSVEVNTDKGTVVISGLCTVSDNFNPPPELGIPVITPGIHTQPMDAYDSLVRIKETADIVVALHDKEFAYKETIPW